MKRSNYGPPGQVHPGLHGSQVFGSSNSAIVIAGLMDSTVLTLADAPYTYAPAPMTATTAITRHTASTAFFITHPGKLVPVGIFSGGGDKAHEQMVATT
jgi:hypothetical protein